MNDEERQKALECCLLGDCMSCPIFRFQDCWIMLKDETFSHLNRQQERIEELEIITGLANNRKYYRKFVDEVFCKQKGNELSEPDFDYIYQLYFEQQAEIDDLKRDTVPKLQDSLNRANKYGRATDRENARLKAEIERYEKESNEQFDKWKLLDDRTRQRYAELYKEAKEIVRTEAIKEFAERLKKEAVTKCDWDNCVDVEDIDRLVAEMAGEQNA